MQLTERIKVIDELNDLGTRLARVPTLENALRIHAEAAALADNPDLNPDYLAVSRANQAYALRQLGHYGEASDVLRTALLHLESSAEAPKSYGGYGRVFEELGLVAADMPLLPYEKTETKILNVHLGLEFFGDALDNYGFALMNLSTEIYTSSQLDQRRLRTLGIRAPKARDLYELSALPSEKQAWIEKAVEYATEEVTAREALGEKEGQNLANAYHSLGQALTETVTDAPENYIRARDLFDKVAATPGVHQNTLITMNLRKAWLEYRRNPTNAAAITPLFDVFLANTSVLTGADKNALNRKVQELGNVLGYTEKVKGFY